MRCPECGEDHEDWSLDSKGYVDDGHNVGVVERIKCGKCGNVVQQERP